MPATPMIASTESFTTETVDVLDKPFDRISWGAIIAGTFTALSIQLVLSLLGIGIGLITLDPQTGDNPSGSAIGTGAIIWWTLTSLVSLFLGGMIAGRTAGTFNGSLHGFVTWATVTVATVLLLSTALGGAFQGATGLAQFAARQMPQMAQYMPGQVRDLQATAQDASNRAQAAANDPAAREQAEQQTRAMGQRAARGGAAGTIGGAVALLLGALAAGLGGRLGRETFLRNLGVATPATAPIKR